MNKDDMNKLIGNLSPEELKKEYEESDSLTKFMTDQFYKPSEFVKYLLQKGKRKEAVEFLGNCMGGMVTYACVDIDDSLNMIKEVNEHMRKQIEKMDKVLNKK